MIWRRNSDGSPGTILLSMIYIAPKLAVALRYNEVCFIPLVPKSESSTQYSYITLIA